MKKRTTGKISMAVMLLFSTFLYAQQDPIVGKWKTIDDETSQAKGIVEIYKESNKIYAKIVEILEPEHKKALCEKCTGEDANKPILGLTIVKGLTKDGSEYNSGKILDPKNGNLYKCLMVLENNNKLKVRGYIGFSLLGRTQYWYRLK